LPANAPVVSTACRIENIQAIPQQLIDTWKKFRRFIDTRVPPSPANQDDLRERRHAKQAMRKALRDRNIIRGFEGLLLQQANSCTDPLYIQESQSERQETNTDVNAESLNTALSEQVVCAGSYILNRA